MTTTISALFDHYDEATHAVNALETAGVPSSDISVVAGQGDALHPAGDIETTEENHTGKDAGIGAGVGAVLGGTGGLLAGLGLMAIPGVGPVVAAGWLISTVAGAVAGAVAGGATGGIVGALTNSGVSEEDAHVYAEGVRRGGTLVTARVQEADRERLEDILYASEAVDVTERRGAYRSEGWTAFDEAAPAYPREPMRETRDRAV